ncbi:MAG: DUF2130 domain-containing protein [Bacteroidota bacterium]
MPLITCPNCQHHFEPNDAIRDEIEKNLRSKMVDWQKKKDDEFRQRETEFVKQLQLKDEATAKAIESEKKKLAASLEEQLRKQISGDFANQITVLQQQKTESNERLKTAREKELAFMQKEQELLLKENQIDITVQQMLLERSGTIRNEIQKQESERIQLKETEFNLKLKELEEKLEAQRKLAEEMKRRAEQGSMQSQGEAQELLLENILRENFPFDQVLEVGKGVEGADCVQVIRNGLGNECGRIIYESKRTKTWQNAWVDKLKADLRSKGADIAILVTQTFPKDMIRFGERDGIWICSFSELPGVASLIRSGIIRVFDVHKTSENKGSKMELLYTYLTGNEFRQQVETIADVFLQMKQNLDKERLQAEKKFNEREQQIRKALMATANMFGSVKGIAGGSVGDIALLDGGE